MTPQPARAAVDWIAHALRQELLPEHFTDAEVREAAEIFDAIARQWSMPTEQAVGWIHLQAAPNAANFKSYCVRVSTEQRAEARAYRPPSDYPD
jgi:hypothetical protein